MSDRTKKIILISFFVLCVALFIWLIYLVFFRPAKTTTNVNNVNNANGSLPGTQNGNINRVIRSPDATLPEQNPGTNTDQAQPIADGGPTQTQTVVDQFSGGMMVNPNTNTVQWYDRTTGKFYRLGPDGQPVLMTDAAYIGANSVNWSPNGNQAIITFPDGSKILYDFTTKKQTTLPTELNNFSWSPQSDQIVSKYLDSNNTDNQWLVITKPDGSQSQTVEQLGANADRVIPTWSPNDQVVGTYQKSVNSTQSQIYFLGTQGENYPSALVDGLGFIPNWSPDGRKLLYSTYTADNNNNPHLFIMNGSADKLGTGMIDLGLDTWADKCAFTSDSMTVYCAVPYYLNEGSGIHREFSQGVPDNVYKIDLTTGVSQIIARPVDSDLQQRFSMTNLQLNADGSYLYFTDAATGTIEKIRLK